MMEINKIYQGDTLDILKTFPDESVNLVMTSPPYYGLRNYGVEGQIGLEETFDEYLKKILEITAEIKRVLKKTGQFWLNMGDCYGGSTGMGSDQVNPGKQTAPRPKRLTYWGGNVEKSTLTNPERQQEMGRSGNQKCMLMQPERLAIKMIDEQGWILRNKIKWAKQVLIKKENRTIGSVMPTSVKDRFNESGEEFYFFVKNKKYYSDLDAVRLPNQVLGVTDMRASEFVRTRELYPNSKYRQDEQYMPFPKQSNARINCSKGSEYEQKYGEPWDRFGKKTLKARMEDTKYQDEKTSRSRNIKKLLSEVRLGIKSNTGMEPNKVNDPRGNHEGGPGSWRDFKDNPENSFPKHIERNAHLGMKSAPQPNEPNAFNPAGKNLPTVWLIGSEPHNFQKELGVNVDHFAIFPQALCEIPIKFGSPKGGLVLDPFMGSGTVAVVAKKLGRNYIGIELNKEYIKIAEKRIAAVPESLF